MIQTPPHVYVSQSMRVWGSGAPPYLRRRREQRACWPDRARRVDDLRRVVGGRQATVHGRQVARQAARQVAPLGAGQRVCFNEQFLGEVPRVVEVRHGPLVRRPLVKTRGQGGVRTR